MLREREHLLGQIFSPSLWLFAEKDVNRTDRTNRFYEGIDNPGLVLLHDILMTYCMYDFDLGETSSFSNVVFSSMSHVTSAKGLKVSLWFFIV